MERTHIFLERNVEKSRACWVCVWIHFQSGTATIDYTITICTSEKVQLIVQLGTHTVPEHLNLMPVHRAGHTAQCYWIKTIQNSVLTWQLMKDCSCKLNMFIPKSVPRLRIDTCTCTHYLVMDVLKTFQKCKYLTEMAELTLSGWRKLMSIKCVYKHNTWLKL